MIIFYNKKTNEIIGTIEGRVHPEEHFNVFIQPGNVPKEDIGRYIVPFKPKIVSGRVIEYEPAVPFADLIYDFESGKKNIYDYKIKIDKGRVVGFVKK